MSKTPSKTRSSTKASSSSAKYTPNKRRGLLEDGQWLCDCKPRQPAVCLTVKKDGPNKGKRFYACQHRDKCNFFLFEHDAKTREAECLVKHNCRSENGIVARVLGKDEAPPGLDLKPRGIGDGASATKPKPKPVQQRIFKSLGFTPVAAAATATTTAAARRLSQDDSDVIFTDSDDEDVKEDPARPAPAESESQTLRAYSSGSKSSAGPPTAPTTTITTTTPTNAKKRKRAPFIDDSDDQFGGSDLDDPATQQALATITDESARKQQQQQQMPTPATATRTTKRNTLRITGEQDAGRSAKRTRFDDDAATPTPYRRTDALAAAAAPTTPAADRLARSVVAVAPTEYPKIADEVGELLARQPLSERARMAVQLAMERHELRVKGVARGRDVARAELQAREGRIAELQARIVDLENQRTVDREKLQKLRDFSKSLSAMTVED